MSYSLYTYVHQRGGRTENDQSAAADSAIITKAESVQGGSATVLPPDTTNRVVSATGCASVHFSKVSVAAYAVAAISTITTFTAKGKAITAEAKTKKVEA